MKPVDDSVVLGLKAFKQLRELLATNISLQAIQLMDIIIHFPDGSKTSVKQDNYHSNDPDCKI